MSLSHRYQELGTVPFGPTAAIPIPQEGLDDLKLDSFEDGYKAGWDDAVKAHVNDKDRAVIDVAQRMQDISFTYEEAYVKLSSAMQPLITKIAVSLLPDVAQQALGSHVVEQVNLLMGESATEFVELAVSPDTLEPLRELLNGKVSAPIQFSAEPILSPGQVFLRVTGQEREINLDAVQAGILSALDAFFDQTREDQQHG